MICSNCKVDVEERNKIMEIVKTNGGAYSPALKLNVVNTFLLLKEPNGEKFKYAQIKRIPCLNIQWLYDSVEKGYALPEDKYVIRSDSQNCATNPTPQRSYVENGLKSKPNNQINSFSTNNLSQSLEIVYNNCVESNVSLVETSTQDIIRLIDSLVSNETEEHFLEGCVIFVIGFDRQVIERVKTAVISCGSIFLNEFKSIASHAIIGPNFNQSDMDLLSSNKICKVTIDWLFDCLRQKECCDAIKYQFKDSKDGENSKSKNSKSNETQDLFSLPLRNSCIESARRAYESKIKKVFEEKAKSPKHKSLAKRYNEEEPIQWIDRRDDSPEERPYFPSAYESNLEKKSENSNDLQLSDENEVQIIKDQSIENELIVNQSSDSNKTEEITIPSVSRGFMFSGYDEQTKSEFAQIVYDLKGFVVDSTQVLDSVTHLIIRDPSATEKTLSAIASGIYILKEDFLFESKKNSCFVNEEQFEWGFALSNSCNDSFEKKSVRKKLMISAVEWRKHLNEANDRRKIFHDWNVLMINETKLTKPYAQVLKCGNANVVELSQDLELIHLHQFKYAFIDKNEINLLPKYALIFVKELIKHQKLLNIDFVSHYILNGPNISIFAAISKVLIKDSIINELESKNNRKRVRDTSDDLEVIYSNKHKK